jgi:hypothetical protein
MHSFSQIVADAKDSIDNCTSTPQLKDFVVSVSRSITRFANTLKDKAFGGIDWVNPVSYFLEFWAPTSAQAQADWLQVETALVDMRTYIRALPSELEPLDDYKPDAKLVVVSTLAAVETIYNFQVQQDAQLEKALANLGTDIINVPKVLAQAAKGAADIIANRIVKPLADASSYSLQKILWSIVKGFWWLILLVAAIVAAYIWLVSSGGVAGLVGKAARG